jgi:hypothetical protein
MKVYIVRFRINGNEEVDSVHDSYLKAYEKKRKLEEDAMKSNDFYDFIEVKTMEVE